MRKFLVVGVIATLAVALLAIPASASFDHHFNVLAKTVSSRQHGTTDRFRDKLLDPQNRHDRVGRARGVCRFSHGRAKCHALLHFNGEIGGFGDISVRGDFERHDRRLNVVGGTHEFNGVAGKMLLYTVNRRIDRLHFDLVH